MADLSYEERKRLRRAAEDARDACNRHYGPFIDAVAHPLHILALLDMVDAARSKEVRYEITSIKYLAGELSLRAVGDDEVPQALEAGQVVTLREVQP